MGVWPLSPSWKGGRGMTDLDTLFEVGKVTVKHHLLNLLRGL
jgi:hypothetical protein